MRVLITVLVFILVSGCAINREYPELAPSKHDGDRAVYKIGVGDALVISVWRNPDLSVSVPVRPDGMISTPLVGDTKVEGLTAEELAAQLTEELQNFIRTPQVTVIIQNAVSSEFLQRVRITGAVNGPMSVPHREGMTVMDLVLMAGGVTPLANPNAAKLYRETIEGTKAYPLYLEDILEKGDLRSNYELRPSDTVTVPETSF